MISESSGNFTVGNIQVSPQHNTMVNGEHECRLQPKAMAVLHYLAKNDDRVISNDELLEQVWQGRVVTHSSIQKSVNALRSAFTQLDSHSEYIVYFSKQGYQLVPPKVEGSHNHIVGKHWFLTRPFIATSATVFVTISACFFFFFHSSSPSSNAGLKQVSIHPELNQFTQVQPYVSNTGREKIIEPHAGSDRVAFIRDELNSQGGQNQSHLLIQGQGGQEWQVSVARGNFIALSWSPSGRNIVAIDAHNENETIVGTEQSSADYYTFHIYTLDFKGEKVIEKNSLSHWLGNVSSVSWWDEGTLEFTAYQGSQNKTARYRYSIADQNLSKLAVLKGNDKGTQKSELLVSHVFNKQTAILNLLSTGEQIQFLDKHQMLIGNWPISFKVESMSWLADGRGVLLLSNNNRLSILYTDGRLEKVDYFPTVNGQIKHVRSKNKGQNIVLTVDATLEKGNALTSPLKSDVTFNLHKLPERFMEKGGGFIYSNPHNN